MRRRSSRYRFRFARKVLHCRVVVEETRAAHCCGLQFVLILQAGSKSLISADWTDFKVRPWRN